MGNTNRMTCFWAYALVHIQTFKPSIRYALMAQLRETARAEQRPQLGARF